MQGALVGIVLDLIIVMMILLLYSLVRRIDLMSYQLKDALRRLDALESRPKGSTGGPNTGRERALKP
ncbi:MAG TPA: hypothetical protein VKQ30_17865 [Ktedonobacterales bacterium]|nr:hypothetical protein [Ktedonobacterales bacterium]